MVSVYPILVSQLLKWSGGQVWSKIGKGVFKPGCEKLIFVIAGGEAVFEDDALSEPELLALLVKAEGSPLVIAVLLEGFCTVL